MTYFKKQWSVELQDNVVKCVEEVVCTCKPDALLALTHFDISVQGALHGNIGPTELDTPFDSITKAYEVPHPPSRAQR